MEQGQWAPLAGWLWLPYAAAALLWGSLAAGLMLRLGKEAATWLRGLAGMAALGSAWAVAEWAWQVAPSGPLAMAARLLDTLLLVSMGVVLMMLVHADRPLTFALRRTRSGMHLSVLTVCCLAAVALELYWKASGEMALKAPAGTLALVAQLALSVATLTLLEQHLRQTPAAGRWVAKPLWLGLGLMLGLEIYLTAETLLFSRMSEQSNLLHAFGLLLAWPLLLLTLRRARGASIALRLSHAAAYYSTSLLIAGGYLLLLAAAGSYVKYFGGEWGDALAVLLVLSAAVLALLVGSSTAVRARLRVLVSKHFFSYRYDYREQWLRFTAHLAAGSDPRDVGSRVITGLAGMLEATQGVLWLREPDGVCRVLARTGLPALQAEEAPDGAIVRFLEQTGWVIDMQELRTQPALYAGLELPDWLQAEPLARLVIPLATGRELVGFVVMESPGRGLAVDWEVRDLLKTAARQAASYLVQMQATEALMEARKFEAFNRMSAFVVHDIKNIVTQLALMMSNAQRLRDNPEFQADMLDTVNQSVEKMRRLLVQLREGAPANGTGSVGVGVELEPLLERLMRQAGRRQREVKILRSERLATRGDAQRLERVLGHLMDNALDATSPDQAVWMSLWRDSGSVCVEVGDEGQGMSEDFIRERLFRPFESTKTSGMGIGMHESLRYVRELGGQIDVSSRPGSGTRVTVRLPALEIETHPVLSGNTALAA